MLGGREAGKPGCGEAGKPGCGDAGRQECLGVQMNIENGKLKI
jgi:hypothetical protein